MDKATIVKSKTMKPTRRVKETVKYYFVAFRSENGDFWMGQNLSSDLEWAMSAAAKPPTGYSEARIIECDLPVLGAYTNLDEE